MSKKKTASYFLGKARIKHPQMYIFLIEFETRKWVTNNQEKTIAFSDYSTNVFEPFSANYYKIKQKNNIFGCTRLS